MTTNAVPTSRQALVIDEENMTQPDGSVCLIDRTDITIDRQLMRFADATERSSTLLQIDNKKAGDCQWSNQSVILYSDGSYADHCDIHDSATFKGDRFPVTRKVKVGEATVASWSWGEGPYCGAGETRRGIYHSGTDRGIEQYFDQITSIESIYTCS